MRDGQPDEYFGVYVVVLRQARHQDHDEVVRERREERDAHAHRGLLPLGADAERHAHEHEADRGEREHPPLHLQGRGNRHHDGGVPLFHRVGRGLRGRKNLQRHGGARRQDHDPSHGLK